MLYPAQQREDDQGAFRGHAGDRFGGLSGAQGDPISKCPPRQRGSDQDGGDQRGGAVLAHAGGPEIDQ